ncbi:DUF6624 domain-containing protein [Tenacibaculum sp. MEBiC06402]|uniref:DUF6624 domain-containing protein n=1 Tax=unclassified Tenacibaculum TaxID=2635139 RepID=UPI003B994034
MELKKFADKIIELKNADLKLRDDLIKTGNLGNTYNKKMADLHIQNAKELENIINLIGYPTIDKVGKLASDAAWLIIQHSIGLPHFMKKCAKMLEEAVLDNNANPRNLAYLTDRIATFEGKPQLYGTSFDWDENGEMNPKPYDNLKKVNLRRKSLGLNTIQEQTLLMREQVKNEKQYPPKDLEKRKKEFDEWRRKVGWVSSTQP